MPSDLETRIRNALATVSDQQTPNLSALARSSNLPYRTLVRRFHERGNFEDKRSSQRALNLVQETALRGRVNPPIGKNWAGRFVRRLPEGFFWIKQKPVDKNRLESEDISHLTTWFEHVGGWLEGISPKNIYNFDETGFQVGQTRSQKVVTRYRYSSEKLASVDRGQIVTSIECVAADGWSMVPYLIFKGRTHMEDWFRDNPALDQRYNIQVSPTGWLSDLIALEWLHIFHESTKNRVGINGKRVLFFDGHGSHLTFGFLDFCDQNRIIPISFRPHTSHFAQPLDQKPFLSLKQHFRKENSLTNAWFRPDSAKRQFLEDITLIRKKAITPRIIRSAFRDTGIWPFNPNIVIGPIQKDGMKGMQTTQFSSY
ncbi:transcriptional regulator family: Centromere protein B DNA-binding region [Penicillium frequentans]|uniref:Transcriptional regulator family: Centromere protein B DNA-binding region n=1 Tax=Penicillium frequentans TaxID=3151616 RepID=A0AAD6CXY9_9EURO|nr:transcriptional regulator family: Centromere protein B DNA-binding region [Penicillium glabrum]